MSIFHKHQDHSIASIRIFYLWLNLHPGNGWSFPTNLQGNSRWTLQVVIFTLTKNITHNWGGSCVSEFNPPMLCETMYDLSIWLINCYLKHLPFKSLSVQGRCIDGFMVCHGMWQCGIIHTWWLWPCRQCNNVSLSLIGRLGWIVACDWSKCCIVSFSRLIRQKCILYPALLLPPFLPTALNQTSSTYLLAQQLSTLKAGT